MSKIYVTRVFHNEKWTYLGVYPDVEIAEMMFGHNVAEFKSHNGNLELIELEESQGKVVDATYPLSMLKIRPKKFAISKIFRIFALKIKNTKDYAFKNRFNRFRSDLGTRRPDTALH